MPEDLLDVSDLFKIYQPPHGLFEDPHPAVQAVNGVSFKIAPGETLGLVGESGCGKSTIGRLILKLEDASSGRIVYDGLDLSQLKEQNTRDFHLKVQMIFQDPNSSLNPRMTVKQSLEEPLIVNFKLSAKERSSKIRTMLEKVGMAPNILSHFPHELSGGQKQRVSIARALILEPKLVVADEPLSALDVSIQSQIINLLLDLQEDMGLTYLFISHDLKVVEFIADRIIVMYLGRIMEEAPVERIFSDPKNPYTIALIESIPTADPLKQRDYVPAKGDVPSPIALPQGCFFHTRCPRAKDICRTKAPELTAVAPDHFVACWQAIQAIA